MGNLEHLLKLSDEYRVNFVFDPCVRFVRDQSITKENVMKLLRIADLYGLDDVHERCNNLLKNMRLETLSETVHLEELDVENARHFLEQRIERLETFLDTLYPEFMKLVQCVLCLMTNDSRFTLCAEHCVDYCNHVSFREEAVESMATCSNCRKMFHSMANHSAYRCNVSLFSVDGSKSIMQDVMHDFHKLKHG